MKKIKYAIISIATLYAILLSLVPAHAKFIQKPVVSESHVIKVARQYCDGKKRVTGRTGIATKESKARERARRKWRERVRWLMPWSWGQADWSKAKDHKYSCKKKHGTYRCKASAIPCAGYP